VTQLCLRWRDRRNARPRGEVIDTRQYEVAPIAEDRTAKAFVQTHHYSGTYPAARERVGLWRGAQLVGVAVFSVPCQAKVLSRVFTGDWRDSVELGRFVLLDVVPANGETWFLARAFELLRRDGYRGVVSFSDPVPRRRLDGSLLFPGHLGTIYQAHNAQYLGRGTGRRLRLLPDGRVLNARAVQKIRGGERGWRYATDMLVQAGAPAAPLEIDARRAWLATWLPRCTRPLSHPGNHRYAWPLQRRTAVLLPAQTYPKTLDEASTR
jgi:hypothetical protein